MKKSGITTAIVLGDFQVPFEDPKALAVVEKYMAAHRWDYYIHLGDLMDFDSISSFNMHKPRLIANRRISTDFDIANKILDRHQRIIRANNKLAEFFLLQGNHEERIERYLDENPQFEGLLDIEKLLRLPERGFKWLRVWSDNRKFLKLGKAHFIHGAATGQYHAKKMADDWGSSIFYGHTHDMMCIPRTRRGFQELTVGQSLGCLCLEQEYMRGRPTRWQQGFGVFYFLEDGTFTYYTPRIINHRFVGPDGILYE